MNCRILFYSLFLLFSTFSNAQSTLTNGLIGFYQFDKNSADSSSYGNDGTLMGPTPAMDRFGNDSLAYHFDGINDRIQISSYSNMSPVSAVTIATWIKTGTVPISNQQWIYDRIAGNDGFGLRVNTLGQARLTINGGQQDVVSTTVITDNVWHHVVATYDRNDGFLRMYIDGILEASSSFSSFISYSPEPRNSIGGSTHLGDFYTGDMDDLRIYNRAINPCEIRFLAGTTAYTYTSTFLAVNFDASLSSGSSPLYSWYWNFGDGSVDSSGKVVNHTYGIEGSYHVTLIKTDLCGAIDSISQIITICDSLFAGIQFTSNGLNLNFDGAPSSVNALNYAWNFGDGSSDTGQFINYIYQDTGSYDVTLIVYNLCGQSDSITLSVKVCYLPVANLTYTVVSNSSQGITVRFDANTSIGADTVIFDFGNGNIIIDTAMHTFYVLQTDSSYGEVCLTVKNLCGDSDSVCVSMNSIGMSDVYALDYYFTIYPNPSQDVVNLEIDLFDTKETIELYLISSNGQVVYSKQVRPENNKHQIDVSTLSKGLYFVKISSIKGSSMQKLIIE